MQHFVYIYIWKKKKLWTENILIFGIAIFGNIATRILPFRLPLAIDAAFVGLGLFHIGFLLKKYMNKKYIKKLFNLKIFEFLALIIIVILLIFFNGQVNMRTGDYAIVPLFWFNSITMCILILNFSKWLDKSKYVLIKKLNNVLEYIGENSIVYMLLNQFVLAIIYQVTKRLAISNIVLIIVVQFLSLISTLGCLYIFSIIINSSFLKIFIGKKLNKNDNM